MRNLETFCLILFYVLRLYIILHSWTVFDNLKATHANKDEINAVLTRLFVDRDLWITDVSSVMQRCKMECFQRCSELASAGFNRESVCRCVRVSSVCVILIRSRGHVWHELLWSLGQLLGKTDPLGQNSFSMRAERCCKPVKPPRRVRSQISPIRKHILFMIHI